VENLYLDMRKARPKSTVLYNKAKLGYEIIKSIAEYNPVTFEDDEVFSDFISKVDAFITTQSILQESLEDYLRKEDAKQDEEDYPSMNGNGSKPTVPEMMQPAGANGASAGNDEWDF